MSHPPGTAGRQTKLDGWNTSGGQEGPVPVHDSATSQPPGAAARHTTLGGWNPSGGQALLLPSQDSAASQMSAAARHTVPEGCT